jgi:hypothetical protein
MLGEKMVLFGVLAGRGPGRVARNRVESFTQFAGNETFSSRWVPHQLTDDLWQVKVAKCGQLLRALEATSRILFRYIISGDEGWFHIEYQHAPQWSVSRGEVPQRMDMAIGTTLFMRTAIWGVSGFHLLDLMPSQCRFNAQYFVKHALAPLVQRVFPQGKNRHTPQLNVHLDNCRVHFSKVAEQFFIENQLLHDSNPPDSPDLAPSDFWRFRCIKTGLAGRSFTEPEELLEGVRELLEGIPAAELTAVFEGWVDRVRWVIAHNEQYYSS